VIGVGCGKAAAMRTDSGPFHYDEALDPSLLKNLFASKENKHESLVFKNKAFCEKLSAYA